VSASFAMTHFSGFAALIIAINLAAKPKLITDHLQLAT